MKSLLIIILVFVILDVHSKSGPIQMETNNILVRDFTRFQSEITFHHNNSWEIEVPKLSLLLCQHFVAIGQNKINLWHHY